MSKPVNIHETNGCSVTEVLPGQLTAMRNKFGAESEIGGHVSNFLQAWENYQTEPDPNAQVILRRTMARSVAMIGALLERLL